MKFVADVHLGKLARNLRMLGLDTLYANDYKDSLIIKISNQENRIILTRDQGILKHKNVTQGLFLHSQDPLVQTKEVLAKFDQQMCFAPFSRCLCCNGLLSPLEGENLRKRFQEIPPRVQKEQSRFYFCQDCQKIYWEGSHYYRMKKLVQEIINGEK